MKKVICYILILILIVLLSGCTSNTTSKIAAPTIDKRLPGDAYTVKDLTKIKSIISYNPAFYKQIADLRYKDLTSFDLSGRKNDLLKSCFDTKTKWPQKLPDGFNPNTVLDFNKNPGLGVSKLHDEGITGKGINIAIIDGAFYADHIEYKDRVKMNEEIHCLYEEVTTHASAVASIAIGKTTGVAPGANLYFIGNSNYNITEGKSEFDYSSTAKAIDRIIDVNKTLPKGRKIRVLSISMGWTPEMKGYKEITEAIKRAEKEGIFVVSANLFETNEFYFHGLDIDTLSDKDSLESYKVIPWNDWISLTSQFVGFGKYYEAKLDKDNPDETLLIPINSKTTANEFGEKEYTFWHIGGWSWGIPYIAGLYALACQVKPNITPEVFWDTALKTGEKSIIQKDNKSYIGRIVNPEKLIKSLKGTK